MFEKKTIKLNNVNSTNNYALSMRGSVSFKEGLVVSASHQKNGNGQKGKSWESSADENLLISILIEPNIHIKNQFLISKCVALAIYDLLALYVNDIYIKWPNDILVSKQKIAGTLIQNIFKGNNITHSIIGIGLNINQTNFKAYSPKATSLNLLLNRMLDVDKVQKELLQCLEERVRQLRNGIDQQKEYLSILFLNNKVSAFEAKGQRFMGIIKDVSKDGRLHVLLEDDSVAVFNNQEVKFLF